MYDPDNEQHVRYRERAQEAADRVGLKIYHEHGDPICHWPGDLPGANLLDPFLEDFEKAEPHSFICFADIPLGLFGTRIPQISAALPRWPGLGFKRRPYHEPLRWQLELNFATLDEQLHAKRWAARPRFRFRPRRRR